MDMVTRQHLSKYEYARIISSRVKELASNSKPLIQTDTDDLLKIAEEEYRQGLIRFSLARRINNDKVYVLDFSSKQDGNRESRLLQHFVCR